MKKIFGAAFIAIFALTLLLPVGLRANKNKAFATGTSLVLLPTSIDADFVASNVDTTNETLSSYTPYEGNGNRMAGSALLFDGTAVVEFDPETDVTIANNSEKSLFVYVFLPDTNISKLTIRLQSGDENTDGNPDQAMTWVVESANIYSEIEKPISGLLVPGWRLLEFPFVASTPTIDGVQNDPVFLSNLSFLYIDAKNGENAAQRIGIYGAYVANTSTLSGGEYYLYSNSLESYAFVSTSPYYSNFAVNRLKNDKIQIPSFSSIFDFAWIGGQKFETETGTIDAGLVYFNDLGNIATTTDAVDYRFMMKVSTPSDVKYYNLNSQTGATYSENGNYYLQLVLRAEISEGAWKDIALANAVGVKISDNVNVVWFESTSNSVNVGYKYKFYFSVNSAYWNTTKDKIEFKSSNEKVLKIVNTVYDESGNGYIEVEALKSGKAKLSVSSEFTRTGGENKAVFDAQISVGVASQKKGTNKAVMIVLYCVLGAGALGAIAYGVYAIVKHNKMQIK